MRNVRVQGVVMAATAHAIVENEVRELVRRRGIDPIAEPEAVSRIVDDVVSEYRDRSVTSALPPLGDVAATTRAVLDAVAGFGPLQPLLDDPTVEEIWINEPGRVFIARRGRSELTTLILTAEQVAELVERMLRPTGRRIDLSTPFVDAMLPDGSRLHVVIPNITRRHMAVNIRSRYARADGRLLLCEANQGGLGVEAFMRGSRLIEPAPG
jgi:pilus assembly protein CpaF